VLQYTQTGNLYGGTMAALYKSAELVIKIKAIDVQLDDATSESELDTGQSRHKFRISTTALQSQRERYLSMLQTVDPATYRDICGPSVIRFRGRND